MRRFLLALVVFAIALYGFGGALKIDQADAAWTWRYCAPKSKAIPYAHIWGTTKRCYNPGWWVRIWKPVVYSAPTKVCVDWKPKVTTRVGKKQATSSWLPRQGCAKQGIR